MIDFVLNKYHDHTQFLNNYFLTEKSIGKKVTLAWLNN
jgi:hypothetical protein